MMDEMNEVTAIADDAGDVAVAPKVRWRQARSGPQGSLTARARRL